MAVRFSLGTRFCVTALFIGAACGSLAWLWIENVKGSRNNFLPHHAGGKWILYPSPPSPFEHPRVELWTTFRRSFDLEHEPGRASLTIAGFQRFSIEVNGKESEERAEAKRNWKEPVGLEISKQLHAGENVIVAKVFCSNGPPALWLRLETPECEFGSDESKSKRGL